MSAVVLCGAGLGTSALWSLPSRAVLGHIICALCGSAVSANQPAVPSENTEAQTGKFWRTRARPPIVGLSMTRLMMPTTLSSDSPTDAQDDSSNTIQPSASSNSSSNNSSSISSSGCCLTGGKDAFLWTVQEGSTPAAAVVAAAAVPTSSDAAAAAAAGRRVAVDLTRPASFSVGEDVRHPPRGDRPVLARGRTASYDQGPQLLSAMGAGGDGERAATTGRRLPVRGKSSDFAQPRRTAVVNYSDDYDGDDSCFLPLVRRRTFTGATATPRQLLPEEEHCYERRQLSSRGNSNARGSGGGDRGSGRVPMSVSEDNMLALLSKHPLHDPKKHVRVIQGVGNGSSSTSVNNRGAAAAVLNGSQSSAGNGGGGSGGGEGARAWWDPNGAAASRASRNKFVIRWVVLFLVCVHDLGVVLQ